MILTAPPEVVVGGELATWQYTRGADVGELSFLDLSEVGGGDYSIDVPGVEILFAEPHVQGGVTYLLVGSIDASEHFSLYRYHDTNADFGPDASSQDLLLSMSYPAYVTSVSMSHAGGVCFLLDRRCQDVRRATDTDADGWPDTVALTPFAMAATFPELLETERLSCDGSSQIEVSETNLGSSTPEDFFPNYRLEDTDSDGEANTSVSLNPVPVTPLLVGPLPYDGLAVLSVATEFYEPSQVLEVWLLDANSDDVTMLGSGSPTASGAAGAAAISLSAALATGEHLGVRFSGKTDSQMLLTTLAALPQIREATPYLIPTGAAATITLKGANFTSSTIVEFQDASGTVSALTPTLIDATTLTVSVPAQAAAGDFVYIARKPGEDPEDNALFGASACDPADLE